MMLINEIDAYEKERLSLQNKSIIGRFMEIVVIS